jgi:hypothetical protein
MEALAQLVEGWHDFYHVIGDAAAALMGLLFVSLSLNVGAITRKANADLRLLAIQTFTSYISTLMFALIFLIPDPGRWSLGGPLLGIDLIVLFVLASRILETHQNRLVKWGRGRVAFRFVIPILCFLGVLAIAVSVLMGKTSGLY